MNKAKTLTGDSLLLTLGGFLAFCAERMITFTIGFLIIYETHSTALYTSKNVILFHGFATVVPPVPRATFIKPAPFNCPKIFLIITVVLQTCVKTQYKKQIFRN